ADVGDANMVDNVRYMMAATAADFGLPTERALIWCEECVEFARRNGNRHGLAHALLTRARLRPDDHDVDLEETAATFRAIGDLRCLTRSYLELAEHGPADRQVAYLELALEVADRAHDP